MKLAKIGDSVRSLNTSKGNYITKDKVYKVLAIDHDNMYLITDDRGFTSSVFATRFEVVITLDELMSQNKSLRNNIKELNEQLEANIKAIKELINEYI